MNHGHVSYSTSANAFWFARHEIIRDSKGNQIDYRFLDANPAFEQITGLKNSKIINKTVREVLPDIITSAFDWIGFYGKIWLESEVGKGSVFYISFPANPVSQGKTVTPQADDINPRKLSNHSILIAEDDDMSFLLLETILEKQEINIMRAVSGEEAVSILKEHPETSLILMNLKMPGMGGLAATRAIREFNKTVPIIAQTAHALMDDKSKAIEYGCNDYISKPINHRELINILTNYMDR